MGPLSWHEPAAGLLRLSLEELRALLELRGFALTTSRTIRAVPYFSRRARGASLESSADSWHDCLFFVAELTRGHE